MHSDTPWPDTSYLPHLNGTHWSPLNQRGLGAAPLFQPKKRPAPPDLGRASQGRCLILIPQGLKLSQTEGGRHQPACPPRHGGRSQAAWDTGNPVSPRGCACQPQEATLLTTGLRPPPQLPPASPDGVAKQTSLWGHGQQKDQFRFYQISPSCVFYTKTAKNSDLNNSLRILSGVGMGEGRCTRSPSSP